MGYAYEDHCQEVYEREFCTDYADALSDQWELTKKLSEIKSWVEEIDSELRNKNGVNVSHVDWMLEELFHRMDLKISTEPLHIVSLPQAQLAQVK